MHVRNARDRQHCYLIVNIVTDVHTSFVIIKMTLNFTLINQHLTISLQHINIYTHTHTTVTYIWMICKNNVSVVRGFVSALEQEGRVLEDVVATEWFWGSDGFRGVDTTMTMITCKDTEVAISVYMYTHIYIGTT